MAQKVRREPYINRITHLGCIPQAIAKDGRTMEQILLDIEKEKALERKVLKLKNQMSPRRIARKLNVKESKVKHIIRFDALGLSYLKVGKKVDE